MDTASPHPPNGVQWLMNSNHQTATAARCRKKDIKCALILFFSIPLISPLFFPSRHISRPATKWLNLVSKLPSTHPISPPSLSIWTAANVDGVESTDTSAGVALFSSEIGSLRLARLPLALRFYSSWCHFISFAYSPFFSLTSLAITSHSYDLVFCSMCLLCIPFVYPFPKHFLR
ncbi:hypothetical protein BC940DRAFT_307218 [Gongronella butleri]|nr:hypothetical protein BC940DRAFT_307218 [Gongronella butleri]